MKLQVCSDMDTSIEREYCILEQLSDSTSGATVVGIPRVHWFGRESKFNAMVLELLGPSLYDLITVRGKFNPLTVCYIGDQLVSSPRSPSRHPNTDAFLAFTTSTHPFLRLHPRGHPTTKRLNGTPRQVPHSLCHRFWHCQTTSPLRNPHPCPHPSRAWLSSRHAGFRVHQQPPRRRTEST